jgi:glycosidase
MKTDEQEIIIEDIRPAVEDSLTPAKGCAGLMQQVSCRAYSHGTRIIGAQVDYLAPGSRTWKSENLTPAAEDTFTGWFPIAKTGTYRFRITAWYDDLRTWLRDTTAWKNAGEDVDADIAAGMESIRAGMARARGRDRKALEKIISSAGSSAEGAISIIRDNYHLLEKYWPRSNSARSGIMKLEAFPEAAYFSSWYELFPRSQSDVPGKHGTFRDVIRRMPDIAAMGFDVIYLTPVHPIGQTSRRGKNGIIPAGKDDPGSPWAIGSALGGHKSINPELGTMSDFREMVSAAGKHGLKIAMDIALQCSPDHPYVKDHPEWFYHRPDGSIRYAENPPKKYFDIYPLNFDTEDRENLWKEMLGIFEFWISQGIRIFRVDNPHTKPLPFWKWIISSIREKHPDAVFLAEAFTKPSVMYKLSRIGFQQSYTYFTWRNFDWEIREYFNEINRPEISSFFWPMLFTNTPDILPFVLQRGGRPAFMMRAVLAATLSPLWGIYSGYELCENEGIPGREEYMDAEKYEIKQRDWLADGNIRDIISLLNKIRKNVVNFHLHGNVKFLNSSNPSILAYYRYYPGYPSVMVVVNINPYETCEATVQVPPDWVRSSDCAGYDVMDMMTGEKYCWHNEYNYVRLVPEYRPAHILVRE